MLKLPSVSLPFGKRSQTKSHNRPSPSPSSSAQSLHPSESTHNSSRDKLPVQTLSANSDHTHSHTASVSLKRRCQLNFKHLTHSPSPSSATHANTNISQPTSSNPSAASSSSLNSKDNNYKPIHKEACSKPRKHSSSISSSTSNSSRRTTHISSHNSSIPNKNNLLLDQRMPASHPYPAPTPHLLPSPLSPIGSPATAMNYNQQQLSLLRRHHTLSTGGPRLARLEKQQVLANMAEKDRRFYGGGGGGGGGGGSEAGSLSSDQSAESLSLDSRSNLCLTPILQSSQQPSSNSLIMPELSDHPLLHQPHSNSPSHDNSGIIPTTKNSSPPSTRSPLAAPSHQSGFQLIRGYKGSPAAALRALDLGSPIELTGEDEEHRLDVNINRKTWIQSEHSQAHQLGRELNPATFQQQYNRRLPTVPVEARTGTEPPSSQHSSASFPLYTQAALHRNFSSPSKLQQHSTGSFPSASSRISDSLIYSPSNWNKLSILNRTMKSTESPLQLLPPVRSQTQGESPRSLGITTEELDEEQILASPVDFPQTSSLHRATSDRVSSTGNHLNASQPPSSNTLSHWSEQTNLRRHQSMKADGRWGTSAVTSPDHFENRSSNEPVQLPDSAYNKLDTFFELGSSIGAHSTTLLRSSSNHSNPSSAFSNSMSVAHPSPSGNIAPFSSQSGGVVATMGSPVSVPGLSINPWSPSVEEAKKLREPMLRQASLDTLASNNSSNNSHRMNKTNTSDLSRFRSSSNDDTQGREMNLLHTNFGRMNIGQGKNGEELSSRSNMSLSHRISGVKSPLSTSTSLADLSESTTADVEVASPAVAAPPKKVVLPPLVTDFSRETLLAGTTEARKAPGSINRHPNGVSLLFQGPASAAAFVPPIGHSLSRNVNDPFNFHEKMARVASHNTAAPGIGASTWLTQKERLIGESQSRQSGGEWGSPLPHSPSSQLPTATSAVTNLPQQIQQQILLNQQLQQLQQLQVQQHQLQQQQTQLLNSTMRLPVSSNTTPINGFHTPSMANILQGNAFTYGNMSHNAPGAFFGAGCSPNVVGPAPPPNPSRLQTTITGLPGLGSLSGTSPHVLPSLVNGVGPMAGPNMMNMAKPLPFMNPPLAVANNQGIQELARQKGYNPTQFDTSPPSARFFVIKSYTEEDVHKSLKYEIWASTDLGNKRLDRAFHESHESGPIYLLFSVNASGHFCGMAEMLTAVDYNTSSNVWAQDKWKGIFKVRWVFVKDIPNNALRHIKLTNTPENKPITSSRDTQEVPHDKGIQVLHIMSSYQSRTTLLQDYAWYEHNESQKSQNQQNNETSPPVSNLEPSGPSSSSPPASSSSSSSIRQPRHAVPNTQNQNIRRFTQANSHPGQYAPVAVQVASGI
ncbi:hypothetical protein PCANC_11702 [Puccinia coronata f. sp. avenae]|uniref:YTH domain-containing protein n=1 Tax=Puccinia coronata f. sp. avenae TaxID=200324 RepID=A0A2N5SF16_9BASI|nr:hypothetical protein PCASD_19090 [Puccinia coronata f. sp. avenae]PLW16510.1 hypothetical protein PCANC_11702 [Puccinia coronata f. sp. avenae]